uniref:Uncharacterized protein n=1 Tax=Prevotella sp. GTC17254 TaxID=3236794 RepID=A0AB33J1E9_9BACT
MKILKTNSAEYKVTVNEDGTLNITNLCKNNAPIQNAGVFIQSMGGMESVLHKCKEMTEEQYAEELSERKRQREAAAKRAAEREFEREQQIKAEYDAAFSGEVTETTIENVTILLNYLNSMNWGVWKLPKMTIGYKCCQYNCDGRLATTITLDRPINYDGEMLRKFIVGKTHGFDFRSYAQLR